MSLAIPPSASAAGATPTLPVSRTLKVPVPLPAWALGPFHRPVDAPIVSPEPKSVFACPMRGATVRWEALHTFNPAAIVREGKVYLLYRAEDDTGAMAIGGHTSRFGLAVSSDGVNFERLPAPVFYPADDSQRGTEWEGGCEDPRLVEALDGTYVLTYTQWDRKVPRLAVATSQDLLHWQKYGPAFGKPGSKYHDLNCKSGSIVTTLGDDGLLRAVKLQGRYWMYWGEFTIRLAWSEDLIHWNIVEDEKGDPLVVMSPLPETFDHPLAECGPPALLTAAGIVLMYNAKNGGAHSVPDLAADAYAGGQALFDAGNPAQLITRLSQPFVKPERPFERTGQYGAGTTFVEGLVYFKNRWFLYYGCADSHIGVVATN